MYKNLTNFPMRREGVDMWVIISREYNEDPVGRTMLPSGQGNRLKEILTE